MGFLRRLGIYKNSVYCHNCLYYGLQIKDKCNYGYKKVKKNITPIKHDVEVILDQKYTCKKLNRNNNCKYWENVLSAY